MMDVVFTYEDGSQVLAHYGVKGMKWGQRKEVYSTTTKNGEQLKLVRNRGGALGKLLRAVSPRIKKEADRTYNYDSYVGKKKVGNFQMYRKSPQEMNVVWGSTKRKYRGRGYMQATLSLGESIAKSMGATKMTAELVDSSPDIHTVAKKANWNVVGKNVTQEALDVWGGMTLVEKKL